MMKPHRWISFVAFGVQCSVASLTFAATHPNQDALPNPFFVMDNGLNDAAHRTLEAKADLDAVQLREKFGPKLGICGNSNIQIWETGDEKLIRQEVLRKLNAAKGGGYIFQSDHSVASNVSGRTYDYIVKLVRRYGKYPLKLDEFNETL